MTTRRRIVLGFTLIELMIVVAIIGILAAIAIPNFIRFQGKSKQSEARTNLKAVFTGQRSRFGERDRYSNQIGEIGFAPERGNRYLYDLGPANGFLSCGNASSAALFEPRSTATTPIGSWDGVEADQNRYGTLFSTAPLVAGSTLGLGVVGWVSSGAAVAPMTSGQVGYDSAVCPQCDFGACAIGEVDNDSAADVWFVGSQFASLGASACSEGSPGASQEQPGAPMNAKSDVGCMH